MKTNIILKIAMLCVICAATMMSGCLEVETEIVSAEDSKTEIARTLSDSDLIKFGTYKNPMPLDKILISSTGALAIAITNIRRGDEVNNMIYRENMFNDPPKSGNEYMLVAMNVIYIKMDHLDIDDKFLLSNYDFNAYANGIECDSPFLVLPDELDTSSSIYMMPGSESLVWMVYEVPKNDRVIIAYERMFVDDIYYFDAGTGNFDYGDTK